MNPILILSIVFAIAVSSIGYLILLLNALGGMAFNWKRIDIPLFADMLIAGREAGFDVDLIVETVIDVFLGKVDPTDIPAQVLQEIKDVVINFTRAPAKTGMAIGTGIGFNELGFAVLGTFLDAFGMPTEKKIRRHHTRMGKEAD